MDKLKVLTIVGTRPEAIKMAPVHSELLKRNAVTPLLLASGQHPNLLFTAFQDFGLAPDLTLEGFPPGLALAEMSARVLGNVTDALEKTNPDLVLVHGDTSTTYMSALAAFYLGIPVGHVEAGLRTNNLLSPFPEELNRQAVARIANWHFAPTESAKQNLLREGIPEPSIYVTGNTIVDALKMVSATQATAPKDDFVLVTLHRRENLAGGMEETIRALAKFALEEPTIRFLFPMHPNPRVREIAHRHLAQCSNVELVEPIGYRDFVAALTACRFVLSDSGGIQEEAVTLGKRVLVARDQSERAEDGAAGLMIVVGSAYESVLSALRSAAKAVNPHTPNSGQWTDIFGDGQASRRIADALLANI